MAVIATGFRENDSEAQILGHSNPKMTLDTYAHLSPEYINEQRRVMEAPMYAPSA